MAVTNPASLLSGGIAGGVTDALKNITPSSSATSGPSTSGPIDNAGSQSFAQTSNFSVGSGSASGSSAASAGSSSQTLLIVAIAAATLILAVVLGRRK